MNDVDKYLKKVSAGLHKLPESERNEILNEIKNHIHEAESRQEPVQTILDKLGSPIKLAQSYVSIYNIDSGDISFGSILGNMAFFLSAGLSGIIVIPTLSIMIVGFLFSAVFSIGYSIVDLIIGLPGPGGIVLGDNVLTGFTAVLVALIAGAILVILAYFCWWVLKKYILFVSQRYKKMHM